MQVANCEHHIVTDLAQLDECVKQLGSKLILKASRDGYDGYGQWRLSDEADLPELKNALQGLDLQTVPLVVGYELRRCAGCGTIPSRRQATCKRTCSSCT